jgi:DHA2 family methylenomycin A resistance protein-like MFS transporter
MPAALAAGAAVTFVMTGVLFVLPLVFRQALGLTPFETGLAVRQFGATLGVAIMGTFASVGSGSGDSAWALFLAAAVCAAVLLVTPRAGSRRTP